MAARQRKWARKTKKYLVLILGGKCAKCGGQKKLQFDVMLSVEPLKEGKRKHHQMEYSWRMSFYSKQHRNNNLQLLCSKCHGKKSSVDKRTKKKQNDNTPF